MHFVLYKQHTTQHIKYITTILVKIYKPFINIQDISHTLQLRNLQYDRN